jgi:hypothetical protein
MRGPLPLSALPVLARTSPQSATPTDPTERAAAAAACAELGCTVRTLDLPALLADAAEFDG